MTANGPPPNYYAILEVSDTASTTTIRDAYKRAALKTHPDRVPVYSPDRLTRTRKFQLINDAYYTLSDPARRREYDAQRKLFGFSASAFGSDFDSAFEGEEEAQKESSQQSSQQQQKHQQTPYFSWAWNFFARQQGQHEQQQNPNTAGSAEEQRARAENAQFADVFEEMLREEGMADPHDGNRPTHKFWSVVGGLSGGALGFIIGNVPGLLAGAVAGNRLGAVRDTRGKSVYAVFQDLPQADKARLLSQLAAKVFAHTVGV